MSEQSQGTIWLDGVAPGFKPGLTYGDGYKVGRTQAWLLIDARPLKTGTYVVGHRGHQELLNFFGPEKEWMPGTIIGWRRLTPRGWVRDDPVERFHATHCMLVEFPK